MFSLNICFYLSFSEEKKSAAKPKKKFKAADLKNMHDILSKNMYKIRQRVRYTPVCQENGCVHIHLLFIRQFLIASTYIQVPCWYSINVFVLDLTTSASPHGRGKYFFLDAVISSNPYLRQAEVVEVVAVTIQIIIFH